MASFNLLTEPWIPAADAGGVVKERGIMETLLNAHELSAIVDPAPPIQFGIYRFLIAFVMDAYEITELEQVEELLNAGKFSQEILNNYVELKARDCFDLFHPSAPFMQSPPDPEIKEDTESVVRLFQHLPSGSFGTFFHHVKANVHAISPAVCARGLLTISPFMTSGGAGYSPSINGSPPWYVLVSGRNLFEIIVFNSLWMEIPGLAGDEPVAWRSKKTVIPKEEAKCSSVLEGLTWRPRRLRFIPDTGGNCSYTGNESPVLVRNMVYGFGFKFAGGWTDPQVAYKVTDKGPSPLRSREERDLWRDTGPLMLLRQEDYLGDNGKISFRRPIVVDQFRELKKLGVIAKAVPEQIEVFGIRTDGNMKIFEWQHVSLALPLEVAQNPRAGSQIQAALDLGEKVAYLMKKALKLAYPREGKGNDKAFETIVQSSQQEVWSALHDSFEQEYLPALALQNVDDANAQLELAEKWKKTLQSVSYVTFEAAVDSLDADAESIRRQVHARDFFRKVVSQSLYPSPDKGQKSKSDRRKGKT
jgi:CRISPR system Cascade subunit CasA